MDDQPCDDEALIPPTATPQGDRMSRQLKDHAGPRRRIIDEHMFVVPVTGARPATFRLQIFDGPGLRPVAVATQAKGEGSSLINSAEKYAAAVWQRHFSSATEPPIWIQRQLMSSNRLDRWQQVTFAVIDRYTLTSPRWHSFDADELAHLVGTVVDPGRGDGTRHDRPNRWNVFATKPCG